MNALMTRLAALCLLLGTGIASAQTSEAPADWHFPPEESALDDGSRLHLVGSATFQRNFVPFYSIALYAPISVRSRDQVLSGLSPCRLRLIWALPELDQNGVRAYWGKALADAGGERYPRVKAKAEHFVSTLPAATRGQNVVFDYVPDAGMRVLVDDQPVLQMAGVEFNRTLLAVWLGPAAPAYLRDALVAGFSRK
jgi:hypothetical protein